jgi:hypothetical protein
MNPATVYKAFTPIDAQLVCSRLEAAGFHPFVADEAAALSMKCGAIGIGGIRVQLPESEFAEAREFLDAPAE